MRSALVVAFGLATVGFSSGAAAEQPTGRFAFVSNATTPADVLWTVRADGTELRKLTRVEAEAETEPEWSPDGRKIAYVQSYDCRRALYGSCDAIWSANMDGTDSRRLTPLRLPGQLSRRAVDFLSPTWSPDGQRIAYVQSIWMTETSNLFVMNANGSGRQRLTRIGDAADPAWSPDGNSIVFTHASAGKRTLDAGRAGDILVLNLETGNIQRLMKTPADESLPQWSPDGRQIAYERWDRAGEYEVFVMNADGTGRRNLSRRRGVTDGSPVWSPGGELIAFASDRASQEPAIYITAADGSGRAVKTRTPDLGLYEFDWAQEVR